MVGTDISPGMVARAEQRAAQWPNARALVQDAAAPAWSSACAAVVSVFGLQQLPAPDGAIATWARALALAAGWWSPSGRNRQTRPTRGAWSTGCWPTMSPREHGKHASRRQ
ncbi:class I SAM-dependent methyltransferase [Yinghuangia aomiensis]